MKKYNNFQRMTNLINRAVEEFDFEVDEQDSLQTIYDDACNVLTDNIDYDRIEECEMSNHHSNLCWSDGMGYDLQASGEFISGKAEGCRWMRKQEDGSFKDIDWFEADTENDYVVCHFDFDSEGQLVCLVCK